LSYALKVDFNIRVAHKYARYAKDLCRIPCRILSG
jgi:hypothetical protein